MNVGKGGHMLLTIMAFSDDNVSLVAAEKYATRGN